MYKLGITGGMGSGKSTASHFFQLKGATIFDADEEAKRYLRSHIELQNRIIAIFGDKVTKNSHLDLSKLAEHVFSNKQYQNTLNKIIWPEIFSLIKSAAEKSTLRNTDLFVVDAALLLEAGYTDFDLFYDKFGKPHLKDGKEISITHSYNFSGIIVGNSPVGIDIEKQREKILRIARKFTPIEECFILISFSFGFLLANE